MRVVEPFLPVQSEPMAISKAITQSSNQSHQMNPEDRLSAMRKVANVDDSGCLTARQSEDKLNPKDMSIQDWLEAQSKDKMIGETVQLFRSRKLCHCKISKDDNNEIKQFIRQCTRLFLRKGVLYYKTETNHPDRNTMQLVLPEAFRKQALQGCDDDLGHLGVERRDLETPPLAWNVH